MKSKFVVYTVLTGDYDSIMQPEVIDNRFDYVLFTDDLSISQVGVWSIRKIPYDHSNSIRVSRYPKMHPVLLLPEYKASLYIDANIQIAKKIIYDIFIELYENGYDWGAVDHPLYNCIYEDAYNVMVYSLESEMAVLNWCHYLRREKYPRYNGLFENNIIFRRHNQRVQKTDEAWWEIYQQYTRRDQLSLMYVLWKNSTLKIGKILPSGENATNSTIVNRKTHSTSSKRTRILNSNLWQHFRNRCRVGLPAKSQSFQDVHYFLYKFPAKLGILLLNLWTIYALIIYGPRIKYEAYLRHKENN